jgi:hypothetical protein
MSLVDEKQGVLPPWDHVNKDSTENQPDFALTEILDSKTKLEKEQNLAENEYD